MSTTPKATTPPPELIKKQAIKEINDNDLTTFEPARDEEEEIEQEWSSDAEQEEEYEYESSDNSEEECEEGQFSFMPGDCTMFRRCVHKKFMEFSCRPGTHWNEEISTCDHPDNADCKSDGVTHKR